MERVIGNLPPSFPSHIFFFFFPNFFSIISPAFFSSLFRLSLSLPPPSPFSPYIHSFAHEHCKWQLQEGIIRHELLVDKLALIEIKRICDVDDNYFIFSVSVG